MLVSTALKCSSISAMANRKRMDSKNNEDVLKMRNTLLSTTSAVIVVSVMPLS